MRNSPPLVGVFGSTGTIGRAVVAELARRGYGARAFARRAAAVPDGPVAVVVDLDAPGAALDGVDVVISCMASRTGVPHDARTVDYQANAQALAAAKAAGVEHFILLSAICVQKPRLAFQLAKLRFEDDLVLSGLRYSIVRPTAFFKSLSGQIGRVRAGKPFLLFGDGTSTASKPISDRDLAAFIVDCIDREERWNRVLPIGGPGPAITPRAQGELLFELTGRPPRFRSISPAMLKSVAAVLGALSRFIPPLRAKAELARIGHYYATESMLEWNQATARYDEGATPETGSDTLEAYYRQVLAGEATVERGDHAVF